MKVGMRVSKAANADIRQLSANYANVFSIRRQIQTFSIMYIVILEFIIFIIFTHIDIEYSSFCDYSRTARTIHIIISIRMYAAAKDNTKSNAAIVDRRT